MAPGGGRVSSAPPCIERGWQGASERAGKAGKRLKPVIRHILASTPRIKHGRQPLVWMAETRRCQMLYAQPDFWTTR